jgi:hypothetical protein
MDILDPKIMVFHPDAAFSDELWPKINMTEKLQVFLVREGLIHSKLKIRWNPTPLVGISRSHYPRVPLVVPTLVMPFIESQVHFQKGLTNPVSLAIPGAWSPGTRSGRFYDKSNFPFFSCSFSI